MGGRKQALCSDGLSGPVRTPDGGAGARRAGGLPAKEERAVSLRD